MSRIQPKILNIRKKILHWYRANKRDLPWRHTNDPYAILVSEMMLQQTQVDRVIPKYEEFLGKFSTIHDLAQASLVDVLRLWSGLGYNRRAKYLWQMAKQIMTESKGKIPDSYDELRKLPGIGDYTANAVLCFAFKKIAPAVDTNVRNVIEHEFNEDKSLSITEIKKLMLDLFPNDHPDEFLHALMDYSSLTLKRPVRQRKNKSPTPFKQTNRFLRGMIVKSLTTGPLPKRKLIQKILKQSHRNLADIQRALEELQREELVRKTDNLLTL